MNRVLLLGSDVTLQGVDSFAWADWRAVPSIDDYELVVVHLGSISEGDGVTSDPRSEQFARFILTRSKGELVLIGDCTMGGIPYYWLPMFPIFHQGRGTGITPRESRFRRWFDLVDSYEHSMRPNDFEANQNRDAYLQYVHRNILFQDVAGEPLATSPAATAIGIELRFTLQWPDRTVEVARPVVWLPEPTSTEPSTAIRILLVDIYGIGAGSPAPAWLESWETPAQRDLESRMEQLRINREALDEELRVERERWEIAARVRRILYLQGAELEEEVRHCLELLDATICPSPRAGWHDGIVQTRQGPEAVLEIKGLTGPVRVGDVRQLDQWVTDLRFPDDGDRWDGRGLFIANAYCSQPPNDRPEAFTERSVEYALQRSYRLLTTRAVFDAVCALQAGELDPDDWWAEVLGGGGPL